MVDLLRDLEPILVSLILLSICTIFAAWALRMACLFSSVKSPNFYHAILTILVICIANVTLNFFLQVTQVPPGPGKHLIAPFVATATMIALTIQTGPFSAILVTVSFASICSATYYFLLLVSEVV